jgi:hypothetical protein
MVVMAIAEDIVSYRVDMSVIATSRRGNLTAARMAAWMAAFQPQSQIRGQVMQAADSLIPLFVENIMRSELLLKAADSAGVVLDTTETAEIRAAFYSGASRIMRELELSPEQLATAGVTRAEREKAAAARVDAYVERLLKNEGQYIEVPEQMAIVLRNTFETRVVTSALDRALAEATRLGAAADSTSAAAPAMPPSAVPLPSPAPR